MPALSPTMEQGVIVSWEIQEGEEVTPNSILAQVEPDKAVVAFESVEEGYMAKILVPAGAGDTVVGVPVCVICEEEEDIAAFANFTLEAQPEATPEPAAPAATPTPAPAASAPSTPAPAQAAPSNSGDRVFATPAARKAATAQGYNINEISGTGPSGRVVSADVAEFTPQAAQVSTPAPAAAAAVAAPAAAAPVEASATGEHEDLPLSNMRKVIAQRLTQSKQEVPHYYLTSKITLDNLMKVRTKFNQDLPEGEKLSINDFIIKASAVALRKHPEVNSAWMDTFIRQYNYVDISVAVATPNGLITPIIQDADIKGLSGIGSTARGLYAKAREGTLQPSEFQGGTFTVSNLGAFGISEFSAIINPPQAVILAVGGLEDKVVPTGDAEAPFKNTKVLTVTASLDHRVVDGAQGAQFLKTLKTLLEDPMKMLL